MADNSIQIAKPQTLSDLESTPSTFLRSFRGTIALVGSGVDQTAKSAVTLFCAPSSSSASYPLLAYRPPYHITLFSKDELVRLGKDKVLSTLKAEIDQPHHGFYALGIGGHDKRGVYFSVVIWAAGQRMRKKLGLEPKQFHITLSEKDEHGGAVPLDRGIAAMIAWFPEFGHALAPVLGGAGNANDRTARVVYGGTAAGGASQPPEDLLDQLAFTQFALGDYASAQRVSILLIHQCPASTRGYLWYANAALSVQKYKLAMLAYAQTFEHASHRGQIDEQTDSDVKVMQYVLKKLPLCAQHTEWGSVFLEHEMRQWEEELEAVSPVAAGSLLRPWSKNLRDAVTGLVKEHTPTLTLEPREYLFIPLLTGGTPGVMPTGTRDFTFYKLPRFFRWLIPFYLAAMSTPRDENDIIALRSDALRIRHVLTLTEETPLPTTWFSSTNPSNLPPAISSLIQTNTKGISNTFLPIPNYYPPSVEQMDLVLNLFNDANNTPLLVHCGGGKGRAGTVAACYLAAFGFNKVPSPEELIYDREDLSQPRYPANEAVSILRSLRPGSIETSQQEDFVSKWCSFLWKRRSLFPSLPPEPPLCPLEVEMAPGVSSNTLTFDLLVLVGLPGSGKSFFSQSLLARHPNNVVRISQDDSGSRDACERQIGHAPPAVPGKKKAVVVILDRCNTTRADRAYFLSLASVWATNPAIVHFDFPAELCESRAQMRAGHPTLPPGSRVRTAVKQMREKMEAPLLSAEKGFKAVMTIRSWKACDELLERLAARMASSSSAPGASSSSGEKEPGLGLFKFVRTPHLLDLGAVGDDDIVVGGRGGSSSLISPDLVVSRSSPEVPTKIVITEKIDGANLGFSLPSTFASSFTSSSHSDPASFILVQNRSHYINSQSHAQYKPLFSPGGWLSAHARALLRILLRDAFYPNRYVLFGEWMNATHSIPYTRLPARFIAFDMYDRREGRFVDRGRLEEALEGSGIPVVPVVEEHIVINAGRLNNVMMHDESTAAVENGNTSSESESAAATAVAANFSLDEAKLKQMVHIQSQFYDGKVEGIYVKVERGGWVIGRGKVVRGDFIAGNEHWSKGMIRYNGILEDREE